MTTQQDLEKAYQDARALTAFMTKTPGTANLNSAGVNIGVLADMQSGAGSGNGSQFSDVAGLMQDSVSRAVGTSVYAVREGASYKVVDAGSPAHIVTAAGVRLQHVEGPYLIAISGQSNAAGANTDGPNPASSLVKVWDGVTANWGSSDRTAYPLIRANPHGNLGANNYALARAHRVSRDTGRPVLVIFDAQGGQSIAQWVDTGTASPRFQALAAKVTAALATPLCTSSNRMQVDEIIFAQGEADFESDFGTHLAKLKTLRSQFRAESWCGEETPIYMMAPSELHDRYQWRDALRHLCAEIDNRCIFVPSHGLRTEFSQTGAGDFTHFLGESLWEAGFTRIADARSSEMTPTCFYGRATGAADATDETAMTTFRSLVSRDSWSTIVPPNGPAAVGSISWGYQCAAEGNYSFALGYDCTTDNLANYGLLSGRNLIADVNADYFAAFGYQNTLSARYTLASGRGHTIADEGGVAFGMFSTYLVPEADPVMMKVGAGTTSSSRKTVFGVRKSGRVEMAHLPVYPDNAAALAASLPVGTCYRTAAGDLKVVI